MNPRRNLTPNGSVAVEVAILNDHFPLGKPNSEVTRMNGVAFEKHIGKEHREILDRASRVLERQLESIVEGRYPVGRAGFAGKIPDREKAGQSLEDFLPVASGRSTSVTVSLTEWKGPRAAPPVDTRFASRLRLDCLVRSEGEVRAKPEELLREARSSATSPKPQQPKIKQGQLQLAATHVSLHSPLSRTAWRQRSVLLRVARRDNEFKWAGTRIS